MLFLVLHTIVKMAEEFARLDQGWRFQFYAIIIYCLYYITKFCSESLFHMQDSNINEHTHAILDIKNQAFCSNMFALGLYRK
jgi:hypothetical protein